jgi:hypothetical protein
MALNEHKPGTAFPGVIGRTADESSPAWPQPLRAVAGAPNVLIIVLDDTGFGQLGCYGSPIATPNLDALAAGGLLYSNMHTTALCSPSRSCIITGRNHHANATAAINELATGYPGYNGSIPFENGFLSEMLQQHGYSTYLVGKYHLMPSEFESAVGPFDRWPLGRGFERFYGFLGGDTSHWYPELVYDNHPVEPPRTPRVGLTGLPTSCSSSTTPPSRWRTASRRSTSWAARPHSTTIRGAGPGRATPRSGDGSGRPTAAGSATRSWCTGRRALRHAVRCAPSTRTLSTWCPPSWMSWASSRPPRSPRHRPRRLAGGMPVARTLLRRGGQAIRRADHGRDAHRPGRPLVEALPRHRGPGREP